MAEFLLLPFGSAGDTFPFIGLGRHLKDRGHNVRLLCNGYFRSAVESADLIMDEFWNKQEYLNTMENPDLWHPVKSFNAVVGHPLMARMVEEQHQYIIEQFNRNPNIVVVAGTLAFGARIARETHGLKMASVHLSPTVILSVERPPHLPTMAIPAWWPRSWVRGFYWLADKMFITPTMNKVVGAYRKELVLPKVKNYFRDWIHSRELTMALFPSWFAPPAADWPASIKLMDFPFYDNANPDGLPLEVLEFIQSGPPPIVVTFGSAMRVGAKLFQAAVEACQQLPCRAILLTPFAEQIPQPLPETILHCPFLPLSQILPYTATLIHHGGIGTMSQGLRWGVPQVITPLAHDQFDNAARGEALGVSVTIPGARLSGKNLAKALNKIYDERILHKNAHAISQRFVGIDTFRMIGDELEQFARRPPSTKFRT